MPNTSVVKKVKEKEAVIADLVKKAPAGRARHMAHSKSWNKGWGKYGKR